jgi:hypothetical protein
MAEARTESQWTHTANILCMLANVHRGKGPPMTPEQFMPKPSSSGGSGPALDVPVTVLRDLFVPRPS